MNFYLVGAFLVGGNLPNVGSCGMQTSVHASQCSKADCCSVHYTWAARLGYPDNV
jgi:hypothetical protein